MILDSNKTDIQQAIKISKGRIIGFECGERGRKWERARINHN